MGFSHVEIPVEDPDIIDAIEVRQALAANGLKAVVCGAFGQTRDLTHDDPAVHQVCFDYLEKCFEFCLAWDTKFVAGPMYSAVGKTRLLPPDERKREWDLAVTNLRKASERAATHGLFLAIESLNRFESDLVNTADDLLRLVTDIDRPSAKIMLDSFHMTLEERDLAKAIITVGDHLIHMQVSENYRGAPGTGLTPWAELKKGLDAVNYNGVISIESFTPNSQELAGAVCIWKPFAETQDQFAIDGLAFLKSLYSSS